MFSTLNFYSGSTKPEKSEHATARTENSSAKEKALPTQQKASANGRRCRSCPCSNILPLHNDLSPGLPLDDVHIDVCVHSSACRRVHNESGRVLQVTTELDHVLLVLSCTFCRVCEYAKVPTVPS
eukprot:scpid27239/ scgid23161/ 